jgi:hypothetical protein
MSRVLAKPVHPSTTEISIARWHVSLGLIASLWPNGRPLLVYPNQQTFSESSACLQGARAAAVGRAENVWSFAMKKACPDICCDGRGLPPCTHLPDGQFPHAPHAQIARRANLPQVSALATSGKSERPSRASRLDEEGRTRGRHDT